MVTWSILLKELYMNNRIIFDRIVDALDQTSVNMEPLMTEV